MIRVELAVHLSTRAVAAFDAAVAEGGAPHQRAEMRRLMAERDQLVAALCPVEYGAFGAWALCHVIVEDEAHLDVRPSARAS